jgi:uncharacterized protein DUF6916
VADLDWLTYADFAGRVGDSFDVTGDGRAALPIELVEATESTEPGGQGPDGRTRKQFSLVFRGPASTYLPQATYRLSHAELGELDVFLVPVGTEPDGLRYQAAFA